MKCIHDIGYYYDYDGLTLINTSVRITDRREGFGTMFNYCPICGTKLEPVIKALRQDLKDYFKVFNLESGG